MKKKIVIILIFFFSLLPTFVQSQKEDLFKYWLVQVAEGLEDVNQPVVWVFPKAPEGEAEVKKMINSREARPGPSFNDFSYLIYGGGPQLIRNKYLDTKALPKEEISKVLTRKKILKNSFVIKYPDCWTGNESYFLKGFNGGYGYLEGVQIATLEQLIINQDFRFEKEAQELLNYLYEGKKVPPPIV